MTIERGHFTLSLDQRRFKELISAYPTIAGYWDFDDRRCLETELLQAMSVFSHGERVMAQFFHSVWSHSDEMRLNIIEAASTLDDEDRKLIADWLADPFYP